jgi:O-antigen/teichoic acid export membrane protein
MQQEAVKPPEQNAVAHGRTKRLLEGTIFTVASKVLVFLVGFLSVPLTVRYLGTEGFGIWTTVSTILAMLLMMDLGVANALTNLISQAFAGDSREHASRYATTALFLMVGLAGLLGLAGWAVWPHIHWPALFDLPAQSPNRTLVGRAVGASFLLFLIGLPANLAPRILGGYQEVRIATLFQSLGSIGNLVSIVLLIHFHAGLVALVTASSAALVGANLICLLWIWYAHKPWLRPRRLHLSATAARMMIQSGSEFFLLQLAALVVFNSDNLVVTHYLGPAEVASYSVAWKLVSYAALAQTLMAPALWPAYSEAFARNDLPWVRRTFLRTLWLTMGAALLCCTAFAFFGRWIIQVWATRAAVPDERLLLLMCGWTLISTFMNNTSTVLVAKGETRLQAWCSVLAAIANLGLSIYWVQRIGAVGVVLGTIASYLAVLIVPQTWKVWQVLKPGKASTV